ncbi:MAG: hypothetical protein LBI68_10285 [Azoarcus sp.]|jgi:hypothetical protein|nr:hypothetical protein [Azoarcus sp.]
MPSILYLRSMGHEFPDFLGLAESEAVTMRYLRDICDEELAGYDAILVPAHIDQRGLARREAALTRFLDNGGTLVFNGHLVYPMFGLTPFVPSSGGHKDDLVVESVNAHPVFDGVEDYDISFRRGVSGFYGRGGNPPPPGAVILHRMQADHAPLDWFWERPQGGRILMHAGNTMWMYFGGDTSAARIAPQLLAWLKATSGKRTTCDGKCAQRAALAQSQTSQAKTA